MLRLNFILIAIISLPLFLTNLTPVLAESDAPTNQEPYAGEVLCMPDAYLHTQQDCLALGPSAYLTELAKAGITLPPPPLAAHSPLLEYSTLPYEYIKITTKSAVPIYSSVEDGATGNIARMMAYGFRYLSITQRVENEHGIYYQFDTGEWIWGGDVSRVTPPFFEGFIFRENPPIPFGWVVENSQTRTSPGHNSAKAGNTLNRLDVVYIYQEATVGDEVWYLVGPDEWIEGRYIARVNYNPQPPEGVENDRWIEIDLQQQVLMVYEQGHILFATMISTGTPPFYTRPGLHQIYKKLEKGHMSYADPTDYYYLEDVPWTMYFDKARALHGAYWHSFFGYPRSHGCVNLSISDSRWLYEWANESDYVYVWDPSGETPTDPNFYKDEGGP